MSNLLDIDLAGAKPRRQRPQQSGTNLGGVRGRKPVIPDFELPEPKQRDETDRPGVGDANS